MPNQVVVEFIPDYTKLATAQEELSKSGIGLAQADQFNQMNKAAAAAAENVAKIGVAAKDTAAGVGRLGEALNNAGKGIAGAAGKQAFDVIRGAAAGATGEISKLGSSLDAIKAKLAAVQPGSAAFAQLAAEIKATEIAMAALAKTQANLAAGTATIQQQTRAFQNTLVQLKQAGLDNTEVYKQVKGSMSELQLSTQKVGEEVGGLASETRNLGAVVEAAEGLAGAFEAAAGASAIFGDESGELEKATRRVFAAMALANGIQKLYNVTLKESAAVQAIARGQAALQAVSTRLASAAESEYVVVRWAATAAQTALNAVMAANPVVLLIGALIAAGAALAAFAGSSERAAEANKRLNEAEKSQFEYLQEYQNFASQADRDRVTALQNELTALKAKNVSQTEILKKEQELAIEEGKSAAKSSGYYATEIKNLNDMRTELDNLSQKKKELDQELANKQGHWFLTNWIYGDRTASAINNDIDNTKAKIENLQAKIDTAQKAKDEDAQKSAGWDAANAELHKHLVEEGLKDDVAAAEARLAISKKSTEEELQAEIGLIQRKQALQLNDANLTATQRHAIEEQNARQIRDLEYNYSLQRAKESLAIYQAYANGKLATVQKGSDEELEIEKRLLIQKRDVDLLAARDNVQEQNRVRIQFEADYNALLRNFARQRMLDELETNKLVNQAKLDAALKGTHEEYQLQLQQIELERQAEVAAIDVRVRDTEKGQAQIKEINAKALAEEAALRRAYLQKEIEDETGQAKTVNDIRITRLQGQAGNPNNSQDRQFQLQQQARQVELENIGLEQKATEQLYHNKILTQEQYVQKSLELENERLQKQYEIDNAEEGHRKQILLEVANASIDATQKVADAVFAIRDNEIKQEEENQMAALDRDKEATLNQKFLTSTQKAAIDESFKRQQIAAERQADINKRNNDVNAAEIDGFLAVAKVWAEHASDPVLAAILTAVAIAQTTAQVAKIKSTPLPTYWQGTESVEGPGGPTSDSIIARLSRGERVVPAEINRKYFPALSAIHNEVIQPEVANALLTGEYSPNIAMDALERRIAASPNIDYDQLGAAVAKHMAPALAQLPLNEFSFDENGFVHAVREGLQRRISLEKRYRKR